jgi:hypothetical protein
VCHLFKIPDMPICSHTFVRALLDERVTIRETISRLRIGTLGRSLTPPQREAALNARLEAETEISALIVEFSRYGNYPILCPHNDPGAAPAIRARFPSSPAVPGRGRRVISGLPPRRRNPGERRMTQATVDERSRRDDT